MSKIKYVCFDIGGVANVRTPDCVITSLANNYFRKEFSEEDFRNIIWAGDKDYWRKFINGESNAEIFLTRALEEGKIPVTQRNKKLLCSLLVDWCGVPYQPMLDLVDVLKLNGYHTSVLTNNNEIMYNTSSAEIKNRVDVAISSHEIGRTKPHWDAFCILMGRIGASVPKEVVFVDDKKRNTDAASRYGLQGLLFRSKELGMDAAFSELLDDLSKKGTII